MPGSPASSNSPPSVSDRDGDRAGVDVDVQEARRRTGPSGRRECRRQRERQSDGRLFGGPAQALAVPDLSGARSGLRCFLAGARSDQVRCALMSLIRTRIDPAEHCGFGPRRELHRLQIVFARCDISTMRCQPARSLRCNRRIPANCTHDRREEVRQVLEPIVGLMISSSSLEDLSGIGEEIVERFALRAGARKNRQARRCPRRRRSTAPRRSRELPRARAPERKDPGNGVGLGFVTGERDANLDDAAVDVERRVAVAVFVRGGDVYQPQASNSRVVHRTGNGRSLMSRKSGDHRAERRGRRHHHVPR